MTITTSEDEAGALPPTNASNGASAPLLVVDGLQTYFDLRNGVVKAVDGVSFALAPHETLAIVGESGCGKSITALSLMRLVPDPPGRIAGGSVKLAGVDLLTLDEEAMRGVRGKDMAMIFQEPMTSLNPVFTIGSQIGEAIKLHQHTSRAETRNRTVEALRMVGIADPERRIRDYPHQLSGGMRQRVMIAMALACNPRVLIADEPTTALDVTIQAQILELIRELQARLGLAVILVTHDLGIVAQYTDDVTILYAARVMEQAPTADLFAHPMSPYTKGLLGSIPGIDGSRHRRLTAIPGFIPGPLNPPSGCRFHPRCPIAIDD